MKLVKIDGKSGKFELNSIIVFALSMIANILGILFQSLGGHLLENPQIFADLNAVMAVFNILVLPTTVVTCLLTKYISVLSSQDKYGQIKYLLLVTSRYIGVAVIIFIGIMLLFHKSISDWLHMDDSLVMIIAIILADITLFSSIFIGGLQGCKAFIQYGLFGLVGPIFKIIAVIGAYIMKKGLSTILLIWLIGTFLSYAFGYILIKKVLGNYKPEKFSVGYKDIFSYLVKLTVANLGIILLSNMDILMIKHSFNPEAGLYSAARMLAYSITYLANAFIVVLFPMVADATKSMKENQKLLKKTLIYDIILCSIAVIILELMADFCIRIFVGHKYQGCKGYLLPICLFVIPLSINSLIVNYNMARNKTLFSTCTMIAGGILALMGGMIFCTSVFGLTFYLSVVMWIVVVLNIMNIFIEGRTKIGKVS